jgi:hypothetical protein
MISTRAHGVLDYLSAGSLIALPRLLGWKGGARQILTANAATSLLYSSQTRYELGLLRLLPMSLHLTLDAASGAVLCVAGLQRNNRKGVAAALIGIGLFEIAAAFLTNPEVPIAEEQSV